MHSLVTQLDHCTRSGSGTISETFHLSILNPTPRRQGYINHHCFYHVLGSGPLIYVHYLKLCHNQDNQELSCIGVGIKATPTADMPWNETFSEIMLSDPNRS